MNKKDSKIFTFIKAMLLGIQKAVHHCWMNFKDYIGIDHESTHRWMSIFERKVFEGDVGLSLKWPNRSLGDMLWETEAFVKELSETDSLPTVNEKMQNLMDALNQNVVFSQISPKCCTCSVLFEKRREKLYTQGFVCDIKMEQGHVLGQSSRMVHLPCDDECNQITRGNSKLQSRKQKQLQVPASGSKVKVFAEDMNVLNSKYCEKTQLPVYENSMKTEQFCLNQCDGDCLRLVSPSKSNKSLGDQNILKKRSRTLQESFEVEMQEAMLACDCPPESVSMFLTCNNCSQNSQDVFHEADYSNDENAKEREWSWPLNIFSKYDQTGKEPAVDSLTKATAQTRQTRVQVEYNDVSKMWESVEENEEVAHSPSCIRSRKQGMMSFIVQIFLLKNLWTWICRHRRRKGQHAADVDIFLTKKSVRNPAYMTERDKAQTQKMKSESEEPVHFLQGKQAFDYYKVLAQTETAMNLKQINTDKDYLIKHYRLKKKLLSESAEIAKEFYKWPTEENRLKWIHLKKDIEETEQTLFDARKHVSQVRTRIPFFTLALMSCQAVVLIVLCALLGLERLGIESHKTTRVNIPTFLGSEAVTVVEEPNPWIGPPEHSFWVATAAVTLCMGATTNSLLVAVGDSSHRFSSYIIPNLTRAQLSPEMGCCEMGSHFNRAGTTTFADCIQFTSGLGKWRGGVMCSERTAPNNHVAHVIKPCCERPTGDCRMLSHEHCVLIKGIFHVTLDHCKQTKCMEVLCRLRKNEMIALLPRDNKDLHVAWPDWLSWLSGDTDTSGSTTHENALNQWWRLITAVFLTFGALHLLLVLLVETTIMLSVEVYAGWQRTLLIYVCSALAGEMMACSVEPFRPHVGSSAGAASFLAVASLELLQAWDFLSHPWREAAGLLGITLIFLVLGTFHLISLTSVLTGWTAGFTLCLMIVPYITFRQHPGSGRLRVVLVGFLLFLLVSTIILVCYISILAPASHQPSAMLMRLRQFFQKWECIQYNENVCLTYHDA